MGVQVGHYCGERLMVPVQREAAPEQTSTEGAEENGPSGWFEVPEVTFQASAGWRLAHAWILRLGLARVKSFRFLRVLGELPFKPKPSVAGCLVNVAGPRPAAAPGLYMLPKRTRGAKRDGVKQLLRRLV